MRDLTMESTPFKTSIESTTMDQTSVESRSGEAMSIFAHSIVDVRRPGSRRRRAASKKILSPEIEQHAQPSTERRQQRRAVVERQRARAESELARATTMAMELERQVEQASPMSSSRSPGLLQGTTTRASGIVGISDSRRRNGLVDFDVESPAGGGDQTPVYDEVMRDLERIKRELRKLQRAVETPTTPRVSMRSEARVLDSGVNREAEAGDANEERVVVAEVAQAGGLDKGVQMQKHATRTRAKGVTIRSDDTSPASDTDDTEETFATASSSDVSNEKSSAALTTAHQHDDARIELASIKAEHLQLADATDRTRVADELARINEQEEKAIAHVRQLTAKLARAKCRLDAATAAGERAEAAVAELEAALRRVGEQTEAAEKERAVTETEHRCVGADAEKVAAEVAEVERRVRRAVRELEAARAAARLRDAVRGSAVMAERRSDDDGHVTIARLEYEYLTGRAEFVRVVAEKKAAAAEAWVEALRAGEKEVAMRADAIEMEIGVGAAATRDGEADEADSSREDGSSPEQRAPRRREAARKAMSSPSFDVEEKGKKARVKVSCLKVVTGKKARLNS